LNGILHAPEEVVSAASPPLLVLLQALGHIPVIAHFRLIYPSCFGSPILFENFLCLHLEIYFGPCLYSCFPNTHRTKPQGQRDVGSESVPDPGPECYAKLASGRASQLASHCPSPCRHLGDC
jgi:hypothetical protein